MSDFLDTIIDITSSKYYILLYIAIFLLSMVQGKITSWYVMKRINKVMLSDYKIVDELKNELVKNYKLEDKFTEYYNCFIKTRIYLFLGIAGFIQLIGLLGEQNIDISSRNICMLTITISFIEFRDNRNTSKKIKNEIDIESSKLLHNFRQFELMAMEDSVLDVLVKQKDITESERAEIIKKEARNYLEDDRKWLY
ncbi:MAG: hypothetical protein MJA82_04835 [Clostridia bacterium]|nr:hypothetical protein [Clostridia bacterium]